MSHVARQPARTSTPRLLAVGVGAVLTVQLVTCLWLLSRSYFTQEDFGELQAYHQRPFGAELLKTSVFGHLMPGLILVERIVGGWFRGSWVAASAFTCLVQLGGTIAFTRVLLALHGRRWWLPWPVAAFALGVVGLNTVSWWAATLAPQVAVATSISAVGCALRFDATRRLRHLASLLVMFALAVAFFEKSVLVSAYLGIFVLLVGPGAPSEGWRERWHRVVTLWPVWLVLGVVSALDLAVYFHGAYLDEAGGGAGVGRTTGYLARALPEGVFTSLIGAARPVSSLPGPGWLTPLVATTVALAVVAFTCLRSTLACRAWLWFAITAALSQVLVARGRLGLQGTAAVVSELRYQVDPAWLFLLALSVALPAAGRTLGPRTRRRVVLTVAALPALALPLWLHSVHALSTHAPGAYARHYLAELRGNDLPADAAFLDLAVPDRLVPAPMRPWNLASTVYPVARHDVRITHDPTGALWVAPDGTVGPVRLEDVSSPSRLGCVTGGNGLVPVTTDGLTSAETRPPLLVAVHYRSTSPASVVALVGPAGDPASARFDPPVPVDGTGDLALPVAPAPGDAVYLAVTGADPVCLEDARLVRPR